MSEYRGETGKWKPGGFDEAYDVFRVFVDDQEIAMYRIHPDGALERLMSSGVIYYGTPVAIANQESALRQCRDAWEARTN